MLTTKADKFMRLNEKITKSRILQDTVCHPKDGQRRKKSTLVLCDPSHACHMIKIFFSRYFMSDAPLFEVISPTVYEFCSDTTQMFSV